MDAEALAASMFVPHSNPRVEAGRLVCAIHVCHHVIRILDRRQSVLAADDDFVVVDDAKATRKAKTCSQGASSYFTTQSLSRWSYN